MHFTASPEAIRNRLRDLPQIKRFTELWNLNTIKQNEMSEFLESRLVDFTPTYRFEHEPMLCALAVALEDARCDYSRQILEQIASLRFSETPLAYRVSDICLQRRDSKIRYEQESATLDKFPISFSKDTKISSTINVRADGTSGVHDINAIASRDEPYETFISTQPANDSYDGRVSLGPGGANTKMEESIQTGYFLQYQ